MSRTVAALYDSRAEAELARTRLVSEVKARSPRIIGKDTAGAIGGLKISRADADTYREGVRKGGYLLVAEVTGGATPKRIVELLRQSAGPVGDDGEDQEWGDREKGIHVALPVEGPSQQKREPTSAKPGAHFENGRAQVAEPHPIPEPEIVQGGARVRSHTRETVAEELVSLRDEAVEVETRVSGRPLSDEEVEAGGLFKERVFEVAEMREEPVVTKVAIVREEVIVRKKVTERTETVRDTVRQTQVEVEDLPEPEGGAPRFFRRGSGRAPSAR